MRYVQAPGPTTSVRQGFGDPWRVTGKGVHGYGWGLQSWNPHTHQTPTKHPCAATLWPSLVCIASYINKSTQPT